MISLQTKTKILTKGQKSNILSIDVCSPARDKKPRDADTLCYDKVASDCHATGLVSIYIGGVPPLNSKSNDTPHYPDVHSTLLDRGRDT